jgi:hypothetical protein
MTEAEITIFQAIMGMTFYNSCYASAQAACKTINAKSPPPVTAGMLLMVAIMSMQKGNSGK